MEAYNKMKNLFKIFYRSLIVGLLKLLVFIDFMGLQMSRKFGRHKNVFSALDVVESYLNGIQSKVCKIDGFSTKKEFIFYTPNSMTKFRADTFFTKEPEILDWINTYGKNGDFWDIGSNVGLYAIYFAKSHFKHEVFAFEPSPFNLKQLSKNIQANNATGAISVMPVALSDKVCFQELSFGSEIEVEL